MGPDGVPEKYYLAGRGDTHGEAVWPFCSQQSDFIEESGVISDFFDPEDKSRMLREDVGPDVDQIDRVHTGWIRISRTGILERREEIRGAFSSRAIHHEKDRTPSGLAVSVEIARVRRQGVGTIVHHCRNAVLVTVFIDECRIDVCRIEKIGRVVNVEPLGPVRRDLVAVPSALRDPVPLEEKIVIEICFAGNEMPDHRVKVRVPRLGAHENRRV